MGIRMKARLTIIGAMFLPTMAGLSWLVLVSGGSSAATATCTPDGTALSITANDNKFDKDCLAAPADQDFTISLDNQDRGIPHNVSIYDTKNGDKKTLYQGEIIYGPSKITYSVPAQPGGTYEFICDPHSEFMRGTFIVGSGGQ
jgi:plastocyanin